MRKYLLPILLICFWGCEELDITPPTVSITNAFTGSVSEIVTISVMVTDDSGIDKVELWVDGINTGITDNAEPYTLNWNTSSYQDSSSHIIIVRVYDTSGNIADSQPITLMVDNTESAPQGGDITFVTYTTTEMFISWEQSEDEDLENYKLLYSDSESGDKDTIATYTEKTNTSHTITEFDPTHENWFWVQLTDTLGFIRVGTGMTNEIDSPPTQVDLYPINYENDSFIITWSQNDDADFSSYRLYDSFSEDMSGANLTNETDLVTDTTYTVSGINAGETRYYQVITKDVFGLETESEIKVGMSIRPLPTEFPLHEDAGWVYEGYYYADSIDYIADIPDTVIYDTLFILTDIYEDGYSGYSWDLNNYYDVVKNYDNKLIVAGRHHYYNDSTSFYDLPHFWASYDELYDTTAYVNNYEFFPESRAEVVDNFLGIPYKTYLQKFESYNQNNYVTIEGFAKFTIENYGRIIMTRKLSSNELQNALNIAREKFPRQLKNTFNRHSNIRPMFSPDTYFED